MQRFDDETYYRPQDEAMRLIGTVGSLAVQRHEDKGPPYVKFGSRVLYLGADLNSWLDSRRIEPRGNSKRPRDAVHAAETAAAAA